MLKFISSYASVTKQAYMRPQEKDDCVKQLGKYKDKMHYKITCATFMAVISVHLLEIYDTKMNNMHNYTIYNLYLKHKLRQVSIL